MQKKKSKVITCYIAVNKPISEAIVYEYYHLMHSCYCFFQIILSLVHEGNLFFFSAAVNQHLD